MKADNLIVIKSISYDPEFKIPKSVWKKHNLSYMTQQSFNVIKEFLSSLPKPLKDLTREKLPQNEIHAFLILLAHYDNAQELVVYAKNDLKLSDEQLLILATQMGRLDIIKEFKLQYPSEVIKNISVIFFSACEFAHTPIFDWVEAILSDRTVQLIDCPPKYPAFKLASACGATNLLDRMAKYVTPEKLLEMMKNEEYVGFRLAARDGHIKTLEWYKEQDKDHVLDMIQSDQYFGFRNSLVFSGNLIVSDWLLQEGAANKEQMLAAAHRHNIITSIFDYCNHDNQVGVLEYLKKHSTKGQWHAGLSQFQLPNQFAKAFGANGSAQQKAIIKWLFLAPEFLAYIVKNEEQFKSVLYPLITDTIQQMRDAKNQTSGVYDLTDAEMQLNCFYMLISLIKRNQPELNADIEFLLSIPSIRKTKAIANEAGQQPNQLLALALSVKNTGAEELLKKIPEVQYVLKTQPITSVANANAFFASPSSSSSGWKCVCKSQCLLCTISNGGKSRELIIRNAGQEYISTLKPTTCTEVGVSMQLIVKMGNNTMTQKINEFQGALKFYGIKEDQTPEILIDGQSYFEIKTAFESKDNKTLESIFTIMDKYLVEKEASNNAAPTPK